MFLGKSQPCPVLTPSVWIVVNREDVWSRCRKPSLNTLTLDSSGKISSTTDIGEAFPPVSTVFWMSLTGRIHVKITLCETLQICLGKNLDVGRFWKDFINDRHWIVRVQIFGSVHFWISLNRCTPIFFHFFCQFTCQCKRPNVSALWCTWWRPAFWARRIRQDESDVYNSENNHISYYTWYISNMAINYR